MSGETQKYKRSNFTASVVGGLGSVFGGSGKTYYILEHKISSKYHKLGESQEIIVDNIELGRDSKCQVRYDESFKTVSRRHAAITKKDDQWKLIHLSEKNPTLLNGKQVSKEWYLQNGDEIQLNIGGPKLGFIVPTGSKSKVGSIGLSRRLSLFRQQALRPYKTALTVLSCFILLISIGAGYVINRQGAQIDIFKGNLSETQGRLADVVRENEELINKTAALTARVTKQAVELEGIKNIPTPEPEPEIEELLEKCKDDVYFLYTEKVYITDGNEIQIVKDTVGNPYGWTATGFLLDDGRFVTARHCIQGWRYTVDLSVIEDAAMSDTYKNINIVAKFKARNRKGNELSFSSDDFVINTQYDYKSPCGVFPDGTQGFVYTVNWLNDEEYAKMDKRVHSTDWAFAKASSSGTLTVNVGVSNNLRAGQELHILGFPQGLGVGDTPAVINPPYNKFSVGFDGLDNTGCFLHTRGTDFGNSGGPIFARQGNNLTVIGIVSRGARSDEYNYGVPISAIR